MTHDYQHPYSVIIHGAYKDRDTVAYLDTVVYDPTAVECTSTNLTDSGEAIVVDHKKRHAIPENFSITCFRKPVFNKETESIKYPRTTVAISTTKGPYSIVLQADELNGYNLASEAQRAVRSISAERDAANQGAASERAARQAAENNAAGIQARLDSASVVKHEVFGVGEYDRGTTFRPRYYCYTDTAAKGVEACGSDIPQVTLLRDSAGDRCGYQDYIVSCLRK